MSFIPANSPVTGLELRLLDERGEVIDRIALVDQQVSIGATREGGRICATDPSGVLTIEALFGFDEDKMHLTISGWPGTPVRKALRLAAMLASATIGNVFALGIDSGPELARYEPVHGRIGPIEDTLEWLQILAVLQQHTVQTVVVPDNPPRPQVVSAVRAAAMLDGQTLRGPEKPFEIEVAGSDMPLGTIPGAMFRNPMVIALDNESYVLDRTELIYFRQLQIDPLVPNVAVRAGDTVRLTPHEPAAVLAVPHSFKPGDNLPQLADS